jgi:spore coat protein U-like protein
MKIPISLPLRCARGCALAAAWPHAFAAITCSLSGTAVDMTYTQGTVGTATGSVTLSCDRASGDPTSTTYFVGLNNSDSGTRRVLRHGGAAVAADRLNYDFRKGSTTTSWTGATTGRTSGTLNFGALTTQSVVLPFTFRIASQTGKTAGIYDAITTASLQLTTTGAVVATTTFVTTVSIPTQCFIGQVASGNLAPGTVSPSSLTLNYTSFTPAQSATMDFTVDCTMGTPYTLALSPASGTILGLNYTVGLSSSSATGNGQAQLFTVTGTVGANQSGTCATSASVCTGSQLTTITLTY